MIKVFSVMQAAAAGLMLAFSAAVAEVIEIKWNNGRFAHAVLVPPGKLVEVCGNLKKNQVIEWTFTADKPVPYRTTGSL